MSYVLWGYKCSSKNTIPGLPSENKYWCVVECHLKIIFEIPCRKSLVKEKLTNINWHKSTQTHYIDIRLKIHLMTERNIHYTGKVIVTIDLIWIKPSTNAISYFLTRRWNSFWCQFISFHLKVTKFWSEKSITGQIAFTNTNRY